MNWKKFWEQVERDKKIVKTWPRWMQDIVITSKTCMNGKFIKGKSKDV